MGDGKGFEEFIITIEYFNNKSKGDE